MNDIIVYDHYEIVEGEPTTKNVGDYSLMSDSVNDIQLVEMWANKPRKSQYDLVSQLRGRRRSVEAEIKRVQAETPIDATRAATNGLS